MGVDIPGLHKGEIRHHDHLSRHRFTTMLTCWQGFSNLACLPTIARLAYLTHVYACANARPKARNRRKAR